MAFLLLSFELSVSVVKNPERKRKQKIKKPNKTKQKKKQMITTINKLGHGASYSVRQEILTDIAYQKTEHVNTDDVILLENCSRGNFTILVEDNIDRLEETLSGKYYQLEKSIYIF